MAWDRTGSGIPAAQVLLLVGLDAPPEGGAAAETGWTVAKTAYDGLDAPLLARLRPEHIACPLVAPQFDAVQLAQRLARLGFTGRLTVLAPALPDRRMVAAELAAAAPGIRIVIATG